MDDDGGPSESFAHERHTTWQFGKGFGFSQTRQTRCAAALNRLMFSPCYMVFYALVSAACIAMFIWTLATRRLTTAYVVVDVLLNFIILVEVCLRIFAMTPRRFFESWMNIVDVLIVLACVLTTILEIVELHQRSKNEVGFAAAGSAFLAARALAQALRAFFLLRLQLQRRRLNIINLDDPVEDDIFGDLSEQAVFAPEGDNMNFKAYVAFDDRLQ